jgi:hypothetical protein
MKKAMKNNLQILITFLCIIIAASKGVLPDFNNWFDKATSGQNKLLVSVIAFFAFIVIVYLPLMYLWIWRKNKKAAKFADKNNAVKCCIKHTKMSDILTVHSINGEKPAMFSSGFKLGFYVPAGENTIFVSYVWQPFFANLARKIGGTTSLFGIKQYHIDGKEMKIIAKAGTEYELYYSHNRNRYVFAEKK